MEPMSLRKRRIYFYVLCILFVFIIPPIMLYTSGYRLGPDLLSWKLAAYIFMRPNLGLSSILTGKKGEQRPYSSESGSPKILPREYILF